MKTRLIIFAFVFTACVGIADSIDRTKPITIDAGIVSFTAWEGTLMRMDITNAISSGVISNGWQGYSTNGVCIASTLAVLQNKYLSMCDQLTGSTNHIKLGFTQLEQIVEGIAATNASTSTMLSLRLLTLNAALVREGGVNWWDNCEWKDLP